MKHKRGLLPLSGDPITYGHLDIIKRAMNNCQHLIVAVLNNPDKKSQYVFELDERLKLAEKSIADYCEADNFEVIGSEDSMIDIYLDYGCDVIYRGARDKQDAEYEKQQIRYYEMLLPGISNRVVIFKANPKLAHVQSTVVRNFAEQHLDATSMVSMYTQARLWRQIHGQKVFGITGNHGVGKTALIEAGLGVIRTDGMPAYHIDLQVLRKKVLEGKTPGIEKLKKEIADRPLNQCGAETKAIFMAHLSRLYRHELKGRKGIILVEDTHLIEDGLFHWVNNNIIIVTSTMHMSTPAGDDTCLSTDFKLQQARMVAEKDSYGVVFDFPNNEDTFTPGLGGIIVAKARGGRT